MTDRPASGRPRAAQEPDDSQQTVASLLEERAKYQAWMDALDARRDSSPEHVFHRVRKDYEHRLAQVAAQLARQLPALRDATRGLTDRIAELRAEETALQDARAEAELRAHVGELEEGKWEKLARTHDDGIEAVAARRAALEAELAVVEGLVASTRDSMEMAAIPDEAEESDISASPEESSPATAPEPAEQASGAPVKPLNDELEFLRSVTASGAPGRPAASGQPAPSEQSAQTAQSAQSAQAARKAKLAAAESEARAARKQAKPASAPAPARDEKEEPAEPAAAAPGADDISADPSPESESPRRESGETFFDPADESNPLRGIRSVERPLGANTLGSDSIVLRADSSQPKTLKCAGCGTYNFPTEWYCERCGAELAEL